MFSVPEKGGEGVGLSENRKPEKKPEENRSEGGVGLSENRKPEKNGSGERAVDKMKLVEIVLSLNNLICFAFAFKKSFIP